MSEPTSEPAAPAQTTDHTNQTAPRQGSPYNPLTWMRRLYHWVLSWANTRYGGVALFFMALVEASFFPIPPDVLLIALCLGASHKSLRFAAICAAGSLVGGILGYLIGWGVWSAVQSFFFSYVFTEKTFAHVGALYEKNAFWVVFTAGFTPIPYKVITIAAGVFKINFGIFVLASAISRSLRFFLVAGLIYKFGRPITRFINRHFNWLALAFTALLIGGFVLLKYVL